MTPHTFPFSTRPQLRFDGLQSDGRGSHLHCWTDMGIGASFNTKSAGKREVFKAHDRKRIQFGVRAAK